MSAHETREPTRDLAALPKAHLHLHLDGAIRPATLAELAGEDGMPIPPVSGYGSFAAFSDAIGAASQVLRTPEHLRRVVREVVEDAAADGAVWVEVSVGGRLGADEDAVGMVIEAGREAAEELGVGFGLMLAANRNLDPEQAVRAAELAASLAGQGVVSFGLDNDEAAFPPEPFAQAFAITKDAGLLSTPHAGELAGPASVIGALDSLSADRVLHGVRAGEDPQLVERLAEAGTCLDVCPTSNVLLSVVPSLEAHPLPRLLEAGVRCSINADDPLLFGSGLLEEYTRCRTVLGLTDEQLATAARASLEASGAPRELVLTGLEGIEAWLAGPAVLS